MTDDRSEGALRPGETCWRAEPAGRAAFVVDAADYFRVLADAFERARRSIWILGWDIHSRVALVRDGEGDATRSELGALLDRLARERPNLEVRILCWDFAMLYVLERESFPVFRLDWATHERVHFRLDDRHPVGASHHQKLVVVDGALAFAGGIDLTAHRWDTREHRPDDGRRTTPSGVQTQPFHDVQLAVDGDAARALEALARARWERATGEKIAATDAGGDPWPETLAVDLRDVSVGVARTVPAYDGEEEVREIERGYLDAIGSAREYIYIENQYLSSSRIGEALAERLAEADGPEVVIVSQRRCSGWLEEATMGVLRTRLLRKLRDADAHGRLRACYAVVSRESESYLNVHAKVMIVDDRLARVGSSNLSNRSLGLDTECDLLLEASSDEHRGAIRRFRDGLLAEHLGVEPDAVAERVEAEGGLVAALDALAGGDRTLEPISDEIEPWIDDLVPEESVVDPESPIDADEFSARLLRERGEDPDDAKRKHPVRSIVVTLAVLLGLALAWRFTPLSEWLDPARLAGVARPLIDEPWGPVVIVGAFVLGSLLMVPVTAMIVVASLLYGPLTGWALALAGAVASAMAGFGIGHLMWRETVRSVGGKALNRLSHMLGRRGLVAVATVRIVPVAPFTVVNLVAGASHVRFRDFLLGTLVAMAPGIAALTFLSDRVAAAATDPGPATVLGALGTLALVAGALGLVRRRLSRYGVTPREGD